MSTGMVLGVVGGVVGGFFGAPQIGYAIGSAIGGAIDYSNQPDQEGPRLSDTKVVDSSYGNSIPRVWGAYRVAAQLIWAMPLKEVKKEEDAGKGGGPSIITYHYYFTGAIALCEGPIAGIGKVWSNGEVIFDGRDGVDLSNFDVDEENISNYMRLYRGTQDQERDPRMESEVPDCSAYRGIAYIAFEDLPLARYNNSIPNLEVEILVGGNPPEELPFERTPKKIFYHPDGGSQAPGFFSVDRSKRKYDITMFQQTDSFGTYQDPKEFAQYAVYTGGDAISTKGGFKMLGSASECVLAWDAETNPNGCTLYGKQYDGSNLNRKGWEGIDGIAFRAPFGGWAFQRKAYRFYAVLEVWAFDRNRKKPLFTPINPGTINQSPIGDEPIGIIMVSEMGVHSVNVPNRTRLIVGGGTVEKQYVNRQITDLQVDRKGNTTYVSTRHDTEPYEIEEAHLTVVDGVQTIWRRKYTHPLQGSNIRVCSADDGYLYSCSEGSIPHNAGFAPVCFIHKVKIPPFAADASDIPASAWTHVCNVWVNFEDAHLGAAGPDFGFRFFFCDGRRMFFNFGVGIGDNVNPGGEGLAGVVLTGDSSFGTKMNTVYVSDIVRDVCLEAGLTSDQFDVSELDEPIHGYCIARRSTARSIIEPLRTYFPFDAVESDGKIKFRARGRDVVAELGNEVMGATNAR